MSSVDDLASDLDPRVITFFLAQPAAVPPLGVESDFVNRLSRSADGNVDVSICLVVASLTFFMRMYTKLFLMRQFWLEDYVLLLAYLVFTAMIIVAFRYIERGLYHQWDVRIQELSFFIYNARVISILYGISLAAAKVAILLQYLRVFVPLKRRGYMYWCCHILIWLNIALYFSNIFVVAFQCRPIDFAWKPIGLLFLNIEEACVRIYVYFSTTAAINVALDFIMLLLPQRAIWKLKTSRKKKIGISAVFAVGIFACVASVMRLYYSLETVRNPGDILANVNDMGLWMVPEVASGILIASLPVAPRFFKSLRDAWVGSAIRTLRGTDRSSGVKAKSSQPESSGLGSAGTRVEPDQRYQLNKEYKEGVAQHEAVAQQEAGAPPEADPVESEYSEDEIFDGTFDLSTFEGPSILTLRAQLSDSHIQDKAARGAWLDDASLESRDENNNGNGTWRSTI